MKKLIRAISFILSITLLCSAFSACSGSAVKGHKNIDGLLEDCDYYIIRNHATGLALSANTFGLLDGSLTSVRTYDKNEQDMSMIWRVIAVDSSSYYFQNMATEDRYLSVKKDSKKNGAAMCLEKMDETDGEIFELEKAKEGKNSYRIFSRLTNFCIEPQDGIKDEKTPVIQNYLPYNKDVDYQVWDFERIGDGSKALPQMLSLSGDTQNWSCPEIYNYKDTYYGFIMAGGITIKTSTDLRSWKKQGEIFSPIPSWMKDPVKGVENGSIWAPGIYKIGDTYCCYYCVSTSGSQNSFIGLVTNKTLDPKEKNYKWEDKGIVIHSYKGNDFNAIDPCIVLDDKDVPWLVYGSYWSGIKVRRIDKNTLKLADDDVYDIAAAQSRSGPEAGYMIKHGDYYYLFMACGSFSTGYWNGVARSKSITGPFVDADGKDALKQGATPVTSYRDGFIKCGHSSIMTDKDGKQYHVTEYFREYEDGKTSTSLLGISELLWTEDGWPVTATTPGVVSKLLD